MNSEQSHGMGLRSLETKFAELKLFSQSNQFVMKSN
jgi:hypothetical protein